MRMNGLVCFVLFPTKTKHARTPVATRRAAATTRGRSTGIQSRVWPDVAGFGWVWHGTRFETMAILVKALQCASRGVAN